MEEDKPLIDPHKEEIPQIINNENNINSNKIIIENETLEFQKPEEVKNTNQDRNQVVAIPNSIPIFPF